jgi:group I intron endonuclease
MQFNISDEHKNASGVYIIRNTVNDKVYVGSAKKSSSRYSGHLYQLRKGVHHSVTLQRFVQKYGLEALVFDRLREVGYP